MHVFFAQEFQAEGTVGEFPEIRKYGEFMKFSVTGMWGVCVQGKGGLVQRRKIGHEDWKVGRVQMNNGLIRVGRGEGGTLRDLW